MQNFKRTKYSCYFSYVSIASVFAMPPILFVTFREMYGISYTLLGTLVLVNFCTQLTVDLLFTFFTKHFNIRRSVRVMPLLTCLGLMIYALIPTFFPRFAYAGLLTGTVIFSVSAGLSEVLLSPLVAALPSDNPERDMSMLHSLYALGVVTVVLVSTIFLRIFGTENWMFLTLFWAMLPILSFVLFCTSPMPDMALSHSTSGKSEKRKQLGLILCVICIFLGSAAENAMTNWISVYMESALHIPKALGDIFGLALFAALLGLGRVLNAKYSPNISNVLLFGMVGAAVCYVTVGVSAIPMLSMIACVLTGLFTSMLWPGTLILMEEKIPHPGVTAYALMAAGGDFGGSVAPQLLGVIVDSVAVSHWGTQLAQIFSITPEQAGMKVGMFIAALFPMAGIFLLLGMKKHFRNQPAP